MNCHIITSDQKIADDSELKSLTEYFTGVYIRHFLAHQTNFGEKSCQIYFQTMESDYTLDYKIQGVLFGITYTERN